MTEPLIQKICIPQEYHGQRLDVVLSQIFPEFSRSQLSFWIKAGAITLNEKQARPKDKILGGEQVTLTIDFSPHSSLESHQAENIPLEIVYEDEVLLVLNKPANMVVHPGAGNREHTLVNALLHHSSLLEQLPRAGIIHRLDKDTTGLLLVAKDLPTHTYLIRQMQERAIHRNYLTLVQGHLISGGEIDTFYGRHPKNRLKMAVRPQGKQAVTRYFIRKQYREFTLLDVELLTGRTHQIRVHMNHINHPVVGDPLYGGRIRFPTDASDFTRKSISQFQRQALHACKLQFVHPNLEKTLTIEAPLPEDFQTLLTALDNHFV